MALINIGGIFYEESTVGSGTGNYSSFLRLQANREEDGFNTDDPKEADNKDGIWTHSLKVSDLVAVEIGGVLYYEIRLDLNEGNAAGDPPITLEELQLFYSGAPADGDDYDDGFSGLTKVFDLGAALSLTDINTGSGTDDYRFLIPADLFPDKNAYFTLYSEFSGSDGGFEEWRALANEVGTDGLPAITLTKTANPTSFDEGTPTNVTFTYTLTSQSSDTDPLSLLSFVDDNATPGDDTDDINLLTGALGTDLGDYYVSGDTNGDGLLQNTETWTFQVTINGLDFNAGTTRTNIAQVFAQDDEGNVVDDADDAIVTVNDVLPGITLDKVANVTTISEGAATDVTYTYTLTSQSADTDPLTILTLVDDNGTSGVGEEGDDIDLLEGVDLTHPLGIHYVSGDDGDGLLENDETWIFNYTVQDVVLNAGETRTNVATVTAEDDEGNPVGDDDDATVTGEDVLPTINIVKVASPTQVQAGVLTPVTFTYTLTNTSPSPLDPLTLTELVDDNGTPLNLADDVDLLTGAAGMDLGDYYVSGDDGDALLEHGESWVFEYTTDLLLMPGQSRTNIVSVTGEDDEGNSTGDTDDAVVSAFNLGRTPGFWSNNGSRLWDGDEATFPKGGNLGIVGIAGNGLDLAYTIHDFDANGLDDAGAGSRQFLMIGDWDYDGIADPNENVLIISRADALSLLNSSQKQQQDGRYVLARDVIASWLNYLGGSYVGDPDNATDDSVVHYIDQAVAWLIESTTDENHTLTKAELSSGAVRTRDEAWQDGYDFSVPANGFEHDLPPAGQHELGDAVNLDILGGGAIHSALDHYNNHGFI